MSTAILRQVTHISDDEYLLVFDQDGSKLEVVCNIDIRGGIPSAAFDPADLVTFGHLGDTRPIVAVVLALKRARDGSADSDR
ncbi:hypothetical protein AB0N05_27035 [Nocardia sp. NPDC051030]|uniref:hypothetical protein n=1 Tax=Nocardia sp. NPDC051030 TaxID=3155162 RepID=UPI003427947B